MATKSTFETDSGEIIPIIVYNKLGNEFRKKVRSLNKSWKLTLKK